MSIEFHYDGRLLVDHFPVKDHEKNFSVQWPIEWWETEPTAQIMVATSRGELADLYGKHAMTLAVARDFKVMRPSRQEILNTSGGRIFYTSVGSALMGRSFDYIVISDPLEDHKDQPTLACGWIDHLRIKIRPN